MCARRLPWRLLERRFFGNAPTTQLLNDEIRRHPEQGPRDSIPATHEASMEKSTLALASNISIQRAPSRTDNP
jgi:hypothetical protein